MNREQMTIAIVRSVLERKIAEKRAEEALSPEDIWGHCTLVVTFMDGHVGEYPNTRFLMARGYPDPIVVKDVTTLEIEDDEQTHTLLGVRSFKYDFPKEI